MAYEKQNFTSGQILKAEHLNHMEEGIALNEIPFVSNPNQTLVTDNKGNKTWVERGYYSEIINKDIIVLTNITTIKHNKLNNYNVTDTTWTVDLISGGIYNVILNGVSYSCVPTTDAKGFTYLGNPSIWDGDANQGNNEPFCIRFIGNIITLVTPSAGTYSLTINGPFEYFHKLNGNYTGFFTNDKGAVSTSSKVISYSAKNSFSLGGYSRGENSISQGSSSSAEGANSVALNKSTAGSADQLTCGKSNLVDFSNKYAFIIGNGTSGRSNAHTVDWEGNGWYSGTLECSSITLKSPNGTKYILTIGDNGNLSVIAAE